MSLSSEAVKQTAKVSLKDNWLGAISSSLVIVAFFLVAYNIQYLFSIAFGKIISAIIYSLILFFLFIPLAFGVLRFFWRGLFGVKDKLSSLFYYFSEKRLYKKVILFSLMLLLRFAAWGIILYTPALISDFLASDTIYSMLDISMPMWVSNLWLITTVFQFVAILGIVVLSLRYYLAPVLFVADESIDNSEAIHMSKIISRGSYNDFVYLAFSLIGWLLLCLFLLPVLFVLPYIISCFLVHGRYAIVRYNMHIGGSGKSAPTFSV